MRRIGLTGGIACGKTRVLVRLAARGIATLDLDRVAHEVMAPGGSAHAAVVAAFGPGIIGPGGSIDRQALGSVVFADPHARARLDSLVHPLVREEEARRAAALAATGCRLLVTDAALLVEAGVHLRFDRLVVVHCDEAEQLARLRSRDGLDEAAARSRVAAQMPVAEKRAFGHHEVDTSGRLEDTDRAADALAEELEALGRESPPRRAEVEVLLGGLVYGPQAGPRGLSPSRLLAAAAAAGGLELQDLARRLEPPATGPWYRAALEAGPGAAAANLAVAVAAWALRRGGADAPYLAGAAGSLARLTHAQPAERADACLLGLVAGEVALAGGDTSALESRAARLRPLAVRFGGGEPTGRLDPVWKAASAHATDPAGAGAECARRGGESTLASALAGLGAPVAPSPLAGAVRGALDSVLPA